MSNNNWLTQVIAEETAYENGYEDGKYHMAAQLLDEIEDILDRCANDNGEMICRALRELSKKYKEDLL
jgi:DNA-binding GntR family transcriptional regulator